MSQINTYESVTYTGPASTTRETTPIGPIIAGAVAGACVLAGKALFPKFQESDRMALGEVDVMKGIVPPNVLSDAFARSLRGQQATQLTLQERKDALLSELRTHRLVCPDPAPVKNALDAYLHADANTERQRHAEFMKVVRDGAERSYLDAVSDHVRHALFVSGLDTIVDEGGTGLAQIAGSDNEGRKLRVKVLRRPGDRIALECETFGFDGRQCQGVMDRFHAQLTASGLQYEGRERLWTGPSCALPVSTKRTDAVNPVQPKRNRQ
ncbi:MAG: hypothetical protein IPP83_13495 [Flavobacteriales bacterium]|nr:hypothetical protein [Flavobacteriales bacterium]